MESAYHDVAIISPMVFSRESGTETMAQVVRSSDCRTEPNSLYDALGDIFDGAPGIISGLMSTPNDAVRQGLQKIRIDLPDDSWHGVGAEWVWGQRIEDDVYTLKNSPFYATGVSYGDVVKVNDVNGVLSLEGVMSRGGHSTYRIFAKQGQDDPRVRALFKQLNELHCGIEGANKKLIVIDVLPEADIYKVYGALQDAERSGFIDFEEGHCGHRLAPRVN
jgi:Domain of unknown function (DUF4265)